MTIVSTTKVDPIEINSAKVAHRRVKPANGISYETLFDSFDKDLSKDPATIAPWPNDDLVGTEYEAWS